MGREQPVEYYDHVYAQGHYDRAEAPWRPLWEWAAARSVEPVLEIGCGVGWLPYLLGPRVDYTGVDFSTIAIMKARVRAPHARFVRAHLPGPSGFVKAGTLVAVELLEHVEKDLECLAMAGKDVRVVATLPMRDDPAHVRFFPEERSVRERYQGVLDIQALERVTPHHFGLVALRR